MRSGTLHFEIQTAQENDMGVYLTTPGRTTLVRPCIVLKKEKERPLIIMVTRFSPLNAPISIFIVIVATILARTNHSYPSRP